LNFNRGSFKLTHYHFLRTLEKFPRNYYYVFLLISLIKEEIMKTRELWFAAGLFLALLFADPSFAISAQSASNGESASRARPELITEKDYHELAIQANRVTEQELPQLRTQAQAGDMRSQVLLGLVYQQGCPGAKHDAAEALKWYKLAADQGSSIAADQIAVYYDPAEIFGHERGRDSEQALIWYRKAAARGDDVVAQYNLGAMLHQMGLDAEAVEWYRKATENGDPLGAIGLVGLYDQGKVWPNKNKHENWKEAVEYFQRLADQGNPGAQYVLAQGYREGWLGLHRDTKTAFALYRKAAAQGWPRAVLAVGDCLFKGSGVAKDKAEAVKWLQKAADQEDPIGAQWMALIYENGDGAPKDLVSAYTWYLLAKYYGRSVTFHHQLSPAETEEAEKRVRTFKIEHGGMRY